MKKGHFLIKVLVVFLLYNSIGAAKESSYFIEGKKYFEKKELDKSKILLAYNFFSWFNFHFPDAYVSYI